MVGAKPDVSLLLGRRITLDLTFQSTFKQPSPERYEIENPDFDFELSIIDNGFYPQSTPEYVSMIERAAEALLSPGQRGDAR